MQEFVATINNAANVIFNINGELQKITEAINRLQEPNYLIYVQTVVLIIQVIVTGFLSWKLINVTNDIANKQMKTTLFGKREEDIFSLLGLVAYCKSVQSLTCMLEEKNIFQRVEKEKLCSIFDKYGKEYTKELFNEIFIVRARIHNFDKKFENDILQICKEADEIYEQIYYFVHNLPYLNNHYYVQGILAEKIKKLDCLCNKVVSKEELIRDILREQTSI